MGSNFVSAILVCLIAVLLVELYRKLKSIQTNDARQIDSEGLDLPPVQSRKTSAVIITHTDFDGLTSGALLLRLAGKDAGVAFTSPRGLPAALAGVSAGLVKGDKLYIADLALSPEQESDMRAELKDLYDRGVEIYWFDHHEWPVGLSERTQQFCKVFELNPKVATAAELIRPFLPPSDDYADKLIRFVRRHPMPDETEWEHHWRAMFNELISLRDMDLMETVLHNWASASPPSPAEKILARRGRKREELTKTMAEYRHRHVKTVSGRVFLVIDVRPMRLEKDENGRTLFVVRAPQPSMMIGALACRFHNADFCLILWENFRYSLYRGTDRQISFESLFPEIRIGKFRYKVSGHYYAASVKAFPGVWSALISLFRWRVPREGETLIRLLAEQF